MAEEQQQKQQQNQETDKEEPLNEPKEMTPKEATETGGQTTTTTTATTTTTTSKETGGQFSDLQSVDEECERLLRNIKKQVKQMMEEAVTRKFIHEESSSIIALCVAVDACLSHGLKRRALGLFKTSSSSALIQKVAKSCSSAQEILNMVDEEEKQRQLEEQRQQQLQQQRKQSLSNNINQMTTLSDSNQNNSSIQNNNNNSRGLIQTNSAQNANSLRSPVKQVASNLSVHKRNKWIKLALLERRLVQIVEYLAENAARYYEPEALMSNRLSAEILCSLLMGPCALEFHRGKANDFYYQFEEPSADELLKRHKLSNPIACLCAQQQHHHQQHQQVANPQQQHSQLARSATDNNCLLQQQPGSGTSASVRTTSNSRRQHQQTTCCHRNRRATTSQASLGHYSSALAAAAATATATTNNQQQPADIQKASEANAGGGGASNGQPLARTGSRRRPLALRAANAKSGALVTECHHYSCQEISEHQQPTKGYSFRCTSSNDYTPVNLSLGSLNNHQSSLTASGGGGGGSGGGPNPISPGAISAGGTATDQNNAFNQQQQQQQQQQWPVWSPIMLHETLHQNSKSNLLYAKNNVLLETQPGQRWAGYLSLHQTNSDLILKWIPNQMINGQAANGCSSMPATCDNSNDCCECHCQTNPFDSTTNSGQVKCRSKSEDSEPSCCDCNNSMANHHHQQQLQCKPVGSNYLELIVSLSVSRIVLLHCHFNSASIHMDPTSPKDTNETSDTTSILEETLILVETDGVQRAPFKFPKGGLRWFLSCLESGLRPDKYLEPAIRPEGGSAGGGGGSGGNSSGGSGGQWTWPDPLWECSDSRQLADGTFESSQTTASRLDLILRRLPSLKRRQTKSESNDQQQTASRTSSPTPSELKTALAAPIKTPINYVYRIVSLQPASAGDWPQATPPLSAFSLGSSTTSGGGGGSFGTLIRQSFHSQNSGSLTTSNGDNTSQDQTSTGTNENGHGRGERFRWSLSRLARFRYNSNKDSVSSTSSSIVNLNNNNNNNNDKQATLDGNNETNDAISLGPTSGLDAEKADNNNGPNEQMLIKRDSSAEFSRIETKLRDLNKSSSEELLALRNHSIQTLCESMRKQILARAFYGWLAYCRRSNIIRSHLVKLVTKKKLKTSFEEEKDSEYNKNPLIEFPYETLQCGLTEEIWNKLMIQEEEQAGSGCEKKFNELQLKRAVNQLVYFGGIESNELRVKVWPYLLEQFDFGDTQEDRRRKEEAAREAYLSCGREWIKIERVVKQRDNEILAANMAKVARRNQKAAAAAAAVASPGKSMDQTNAVKRTGSRTISETSEDLYLVDESNNEAEDEFNDNNNNNNEDDINNNTKSQEGIVEEKERQSEMKDDNVGGIEQANQKDLQLQQACDLNAKEQQNTAQVVDIIKDQQPTREQTKATITTTTTTTTTTTNSQTNKSIKQSSTTKATKRRRRRVRLESTGSVGSDASITDQFGNNIHRIDKDVQRCDRNFWYFKDFENLDKLRNIMCSYVWQHLDVGYVQGMCDLAAPFLVVFDDEIRAFTCFSQLMKRMVANFPHGSAMDQHFESLKWLLLDFKRELAYEDVYRVWETIWSAQFVATEHFVVFMALAMVRYYRDIIIENNMDFTDTIKFFNEMAERHDAIKILALARDCILELETLIDDCKRNRAVI